MGLFDFIKKPKKTLDSLPQKEVSLSQGFSAPLERGLSIAETSFLKYLSGHDTDLSTFSQQFKHHYDLDYNKTVDKLLHGGYARIGTAAESLSVNKLPELKSFLSAKGLPVSGKKEDLISRILSQTSDYETYFPKRIFVLTEKGQDFIQQYEKERINTLKNKVTDTISYIRSGHFDSLIPLYEAEPDPRYSISLGYDKNSILADAYAINQYRNMGHDTDRELSLCIVSAMFHSTFKGIEKTMKEIGYQDIDNAEIHTAFTSICSLRSLLDFRYAGIKKYTVSTSGDGRVCAKCAKHDGKTYLVSNAELGKNAPPFCPECRCCILAVFD